jgi:hypothetical protein
LHTDGNRAADDLTKCGDRSGTYAKCRLALNFSAFALRVGATSTAIVMIRNGLYSFEAKALDGVEGGDSGTLVLRDGVIRGGTSFFYIIGTYSCSDGRWKGEMTIEEHTQAPATRPMARRIVSIGFSGTYTDMGAEASGTALIGKQSVRYDAIFRLLLAD